MIVTIVVFLACLVGIFLIGVAIFLWVPRLKTEECQPQNEESVSSCPTITYTGNDIADPTKTELTCTDMIRAFGPELASMSGVQDTSTLSCGDFQQILETDQVKAILGRDSIPSNFCSSECCDASAFQDTPLACIVSDKENDSDLCANMCVNGIDSNDWRCDLGRTFTYSENGLVDSWTQGVYQGVVYGDGEFKTAKTICCTEQLKSGLE